MILMTGVLALAQMCQPAADKGLVAMRPVIAAATTEAVSGIVKRLPEPSISPDAAPAAFLQAAAQALAAGRNDEALEAMERAESRALDRSVRPSLARQPDHKPLVQQIAAARAALASGDRLAALNMIQTAMRDPDASSAAK